MGTPQDTHFCGVLEIFLKNLTTPIFLVGLIYRWGKGPKTKNICINVTFSYTICEKNNFFFFFTFFDFFDFLGRKWDFLGLMEHFINIFVTKWIQKKKKNRIFFLLFRVGVTF